VIAYIRPHNLDNATTLALVLFEETRRLQALDDQNLTGKDRSAEINRTMEHISRVNQMVLAECVYKIVVPEAEVTDGQEILEFINNIPKSWLEKLDQHLKVINASGIDKTIHAKCTECEHEWTTEVEFDPANFFDGPSLV
jgi:hypothetical protein